MIMIDKILKAGTVVKLYGIQVELAQDTAIKITEDNYKLFSFILDDHSSGVEKLELDDSQLCPGYPALKPPSHECGWPQVAPPPPSARAMAGELQTN